MLEDFSEHTTMNQSYVKRYILFQKRCTSLTTMTGNCTPSYTARNLYPSSIVAGAVTSTIGCDMSSKEIGRKN